jgi:hypothetical protein
VEKTTVLQWARLIVTIGGLCLFLAYFFHITDDPRLGMLGVFMVLGHFNPIQEDVNQRLDKVQKQLEELRRKPDSPAR